MLPLKPLELSILIALEEDERYGYDIVRRIGERSGGAVRLAPGNLYSVLDRMISAGLIRQTARQDAEDERRRYYATTALGRRVLQAEVARLRAVLRTVDELALGGRIR
jgi:DNA-binding PadR family transcriptional regulator